MNPPLQSTVETVLSQLDSIPTAEGQGFELWIPEHLMLLGQAAPADVAMALILDKILGKGHEPDCFAQADGGRVYRYRPMK